jgi:hypothetical protein
MKMRPVGAKLFNADRRTDRQAKRIVAFRNFGNARKNGSPNNYKIGAEVLSNTG